jgi:glycosyltransferase involved in cell wall biosynthesis
MQRIRLAIISTHPIQYMAPWFRTLSEEPDIDLKVIFFREPHAPEQGTGFGVEFVWDVPLRQGYASVVLERRHGWKFLGGLVLALRRALRRARPDVVMITGWNEPGLIASYPLAWFMALPTITRGDANLMRERPWWKARLHRLLLSMTSAAVTVGRSNRQFYLVNGVPPSRLFPSCHFVDTDRMLAMSNRHARDRAQLRAAAGFSNDDVVFCFVGKHVAFKRPELLIEATAKLRAKGLPVKLVLAGSGQLTASLKCLAEHHSVPTHFVGFLNQTELWQAYSPSDALVLPSDETETWGLVVNEAMLFGLPVIVSDKVGCGPDLVRDAETGYIFSGSANGLATAMEKLVQQGERRRRMGERGRQLVQAEYSMPVATAGLKVALHEVVRSGKR